MDGDKLRELRESKYLSREELADRIGVDEDRIEEWEEGGYDPYSYEVSLMADAFDMEEDSLKWKLNMDRSIDDDNSSDIGLGGALLGLGAIIGLGFLAGRKRNRLDAESSSGEEDNMDEEDVCVSSNGSYGYSSNSGAEVIKAKTAARESKLSWVFIFLSFAICFGILGFWYLSDYFEEKDALASGKVQVGYYKDFVGKDYEAVIEQFEALGFDNIKLIDLDDSGLMLWKSGDIESISIGGDSRFDSGDYFHPSEPVIISYH